MPRRVVGDLQVLFAVLGILVALPGMASPLPAPLSQAIAKGEWIFNHDSFGSHVQPVLSAGALFANPGLKTTRFMTCDSCHINGGKTRGLLPNGRRISSLRNAVAVFPRYSGAVHRVVTLASQIQRCVTSGIHGRAPRASGQTMTDLISYLTYIAHGQHEDIGGVPR